MTTKDSGWRVLTLLLMACGGEPAPEPPAAEQPATPVPPARRVEITAPLEGDTVVGPAVTIRFEAHGFTVVPAGDTTSNSGHHHIFLDRDPSPPGSPIPAEPNFIVHVGTGADSVVIAQVAPGQHRLIAVVGDGAHVPVEPALVDTVTFFVR